jgi:hypothetical protein
LETLGFGLRKQSCDFVARLGEIDMNNELSDDALGVLNRMPFDPNATYGYEHLSGGFIWSDELPPAGSPEWDIVSEGYLYRMLVAARHDITLGEASPRFQELWEQVVNSAPNWPGLRPERCSGERIRKRLLAAKRRASICYDRLFDPKIDSLEAFIKVLEKEQNRTKRE